MDALPLPKSLPGTLMAAGYINHKKVLRQVRTTPEAAATLTLNWIIVERI